MPMDSLPKEPKTKKYFVWGNSIFSLVPVPAQYIKQAIELEFNGVKRSIIISGPESFNFEANVQGMQRVFRQSEGKEYELTWRKGKSLIRKKKDRI